MKKSEVDKANEVLSGLQAQRDALIARAHELEERRQAIAFDAHSGNKAARAKLDETNSESVTFEYELKSIDSALIEAGKRLAVAEQAQALAQEKQNAQALRAAVDEFVAHATAIDEAFASVVKEAMALEETLKTIHSLGSQFPSRAQLDSLGTRALLTAIQGTPWRRDFETIAPGQRQTFSALVGTWAERIEANHIAPRIGELEVA